MAFVSASVHYLKLWQLRMCSRTLVSRATPFLRKGSGTLQCNGLLWPHDFRGVLTQQTVCVMCDRVCDRVYTLQPLSARTISCTVKYQTLSWECEGLVSETSRTYNINFHHQLPSVRLKEDHSIGPVQPCTSYRGQVQAQTFNREEAVKLVFMLSLRMAGVDPEFEIGGCPKCARKRAKVFFQCHTHFQVHNQPWNCDTIITVGINKHEVVENYNFEAPCGHCC